jgi:hypothetical protein
MGFEKIEDSEWFLEKFCSRASINTFFFDGLLKVSHLNGFGVYNVSFI